IQTAVDLKLLTRIELIKHLRGRPVLHGQHALGHQRTLLGGDQSACLDGVILLGMIQNLLQSRTTDLQGHDVLPPELSTTPIRERPAPPKPARRLPDCAPWGPST